jgi:hypothetical protein
MDGVGRAKRGARPARPPAPLAPAAVLRVGPEGGSGYYPRENFRNLTTLMCILETENFTFVLHVFSTAQKQTSLKITLEYSQISRMCATFA